MKAATHEDVTRFAPSLLRRALATAKSFTIDNNSIEEAVALFTKIFGE